MMKINVPSIDQNKLLDDCIEHIHESNRKNRLQKCKNEIVVHSMNYKNIASNGTLSDELPPINPLGSVYKEDMIYLYDERLVQSIKGRFYYDKIIANAPQGICPICGHRDVDTLDHFLPKSIFFQYSVSIGNLVPVCLKCNKNKLTNAPEDRAHEVIHPYYDDFDDEIWLYAKINVDAGNPFGFLYSVIKPNSWDETKFTRAKNHMRVYKLKALFRVLSASVINSELKSYKKLYEKTHDIDFVRDHVKDLCDIEREENMNSWKAAMYQSMYDSDWMWIDFFPKYVEE